MADSKILQAETADIFAGHLGHLTAAQQELFSIFKDNLAKANLYSPPTSTSKASHDEPTLLWVFSLLQCTLPTTLGDM
jgi:hypothetical protein